MEHKSKFILGLNNGKIKRKQRKYFSDKEKHQIIQEQISQGCTKQEIWQKYTGDKDEHGHLLRWMRQLGYNDADENRSANFAVKGTPMKKKQPNEIQTDISFENLQLKKRIAELEKQLKDAEMKAIAFSTMVDIAEKEFKIPIRKKLNTKP